MTCRVVTAGENGGGVHAPVMGFLVSRDAPVGNRRGEPHEAHVMMDAHEFIERLIELGLNSARRVGIALITREVVHLPADTRPEPVSPPVDVFVA